MAPADREAERQAKAEARREWRETLVAVPVARETEKAVAATALLYPSCSPGMCRTFTMWFPKSRLQDGCVPRWLVLAKLEEAAQAAQGRRNDVKFEAEASWAGCSVTASTPGGW